jgi:hypothetical protein
MEQVSLRLYFTAWVLVSDIFPDLLHVEAGGDMREKDDKNDMLVLDEAIFCVFIPLVVFFIVMIWAGEVARMYRAGSFLAIREPNYQSIRR